MSAPSPAARAAVKALLKVEEGGFSNLVFKKAAGSLPEGRDRAFASALFYGALERQLTLEGLLDPYLKKGTSGLDPQVRAVLETGLYRALYMSAPAAAAVSDSVEICRSLGRSSAAGLVNAVLRRAIEGAGRRMAELEDWQRISVCPVLLRQLREDYGGDAEGICEAFFERRPDCLRVNTLKTTSRELAEALGPLAGEDCPLENALFAKGGYINTPAFSDGWFHVVGLPAQLAAMALDPKPGQRVLDLCAAPGGKTMVLAQLMQDRGEILALDRSEHRLELLRRNARRLGIHCVTTAAADSSGDLSELGLFQRVLCDAPCSGYGEIAKKPELRYRDPELSAGLPELQLQLLCQGAKRVAKGGRLVYSTCTILKRENHQVCREFLQRNPGFSSIPVETPPGACVEDGDFALFLPGKWGNEGFYIATFERMC